MSLFKFEAAQSMRNSRAGPHMLLVFAVLIFISVSVNLWEGTPLALTLSGQLTALFLVLSTPFWSVQRTHKKPQWWVLLSFFMLSVFYFVAIAISAIIGTVDVPAVLYHAQAGVVDFTSEYVTKVKWLVAGTWAAFIITSYMGLVRSRYGPAFVLGVSALLLGLNPFVQYGFSYLAYQTGLTKSGETLSLAEMTDPARDLVPPASKKNLVIVYLEGLERTYRTDPVFRGSYDEIAALAAEGITFSEIDQIENTGWSIAGMTASQCGVPLFRYGTFAYNSFNGLDTFMPRLTCIGDILSAEGYRQNFVVGANIKFAGMDNFYFGHGYDEMFGMSAIRHADLFSGWIYDSEVFREARERLLDLNSSEQPYNLVVETIAPHGPFGWISEGCRLPGQDGKSEDILPAVACLGRETRDFVAFIRQTVNMDNTVIVLVSDHLGHRNNMTAALDARERRNTAIILGAGIEPQLIDKRGSMVDIAPTILELLGYTLPRRQFNLGISLLSDRPTNLEAYGMEAFNQAILYDWRFVESLWVK